MGRRVHPAPALVAAIVAIGGAGACRGPDAVTCGDPVPGPSPLPSFAVAPDPSLAEAAAWDATIRTTCGDVVVRLDGAAAPRAAASFLELADSGYWEGSQCDRLTGRLAPTRLLQCGESPGREVSSPGYDLGPENVPAAHRYERGMVGMVTAGFDRTRAGEFFFVHEDFTATPEVMAEPAIVGRVVSGMEVIDAVAAAGVEDGVPDWHPYTNIGVRSVSVARSTEVQGRPGSSGPTSYRP